MRSGSRSRTTVLPFPFAFVLTFVFSLAFSLLSAFLSSFSSAFAFAFVPMGGSARGTRLVGRIPRSPRMWGLVGIIASLEVSVVESSHVAAGNCVSQLVAFASQSVLG